MLETANIFVTGGAGCLGRAIARKRKEEGWRGKFTVYSTDEHKHAYMRKLFPDINFVQGDIRNPETLYNAMVGHDVVLHCAAVKVIPTSEFYSIDTYDVNVNGSLNVCIQAMRAGVRHVLGVSTDKVCHAVNAYGATKYLMEKIFQEYSRIESDTQFHLVRFGNVLESTGSVIEMWKNAVENSLPIKITNPKMTRFWLSPKQASQYAVDALQLESGQIYVARMPALSILKLLEYTIGLDREIEQIPLRPGEKIHETLLTQDETPYTTLHSDEFYVLNPTTSPRHPSGIVVFYPYSSDSARELTREELMALLND